MPVTALGCQTMNVGAACSFAASKKAAQSIPGARRSNSSRLQWLLAFSTSDDAVRVQCVPAMRRSSANTRSAFASESTTPASFSIVAMCWR